MNLHIGKPGDPVDEIARHADGQIGPTHEKPDLSGVVRQVHRSLTCRIAAPDQRHLLSGYELAFRRRRPVVHTRDLEGRQIFYGQFSISSAAGNDY